MRLISIFVFAFLLVSCASSPMMSAIESGDEAKVFAVASDLANQGHPGGLTVLAAFYEHGSTRAGVQPNRDRAIALLTLAARRGHNPARLKLAELGAPKYLTERGLLIRKPRCEWAAITCPAHKGGAEKTPSLNVSMIDGHFRCMACGAKGGDVLALHRLITGLGFRDAVRDLGGRFHG